MTGALDPQRIAPLSAREWDEVAQGLPAELRRPQMEPLRILTTLGRHPTLLRSWLRFTGRLNTGSLPARLRELVVLRTVWRCRGAYEWGPHVVVAQSAGLTDRDIERIVAGPQCWADYSIEQALLMAVDRLHDTATIDEACWATLATRLNADQLVGQYHLASFVVNALRIDPEPGSAPFPFAAQSDSETAP